MVVSDLNYHRIPKPRTLIIVRYIKFFISDYKLKMEGNSITRASFIGLHNRPEALCQGFGC